MIRAINLFCPIHKEVIERTVTDKLKRAPRVGNSLPIVTLSMSEVIHGVGIPFVARAPMRNIQDSIENGVTEVHVGVGHVNLCTEHHLAWLHVARIHFLKKTEALLHRTVAERRIDARLSGSALLLGYLLCRLLIHIGLSLLDERNGKIPKLLNIAARTINASPFQATPLCISLDSFNLF